MNDRNNGQATAAPADQAVFNNDAGAAGAAQGKFDLQAPLAANFRGDVIKLIPKYIPGITPWSAYKEAVLMHVIHSYNTMAAANRFKNQLIAISNLIKTKVSLGIRPSLAAIGTTGPTLYMMGPDPTNTTYANLCRPGHIHAIYQGKAMLAGPRAWASPTVYESTINPMHNNARTQYPVRPAPAGQSQATTPQHHSSAALEQNLCFWCLEKGHFRRECPKAAASVPKAVNAMDPPYYMYKEDPAGYEPDMEAYGNVHYMDRRRPRPPRMPFSIQGMLL